MVRPASCHEHALLPSSCCWCCGWWWWSASSPWALHTALDPPFPAAVSQVRGARVVLLNDSINKRENVQAVLGAAGLSEQASAIAMLSAHKTGRGVIGYFEDPEEAKKLVSEINRLGMLADGGLGLPAALKVTCEECDFYKGNNKDTAAGSNGSNGGSDKGEVASGA